MKDHYNFGIYLAGILLLLMFTVSIACAQYTGVTPTLGTTSPTPTLTLGTTPPTTPPATLGTTSPTPTQTLGTAPPTTPPGTIGGNGIPLNPVICVGALSCIGLLIVLKKRK